MNGCPSRYTYVLLWLCLALLVSDESCLALSRQPLSLAPSQANPIYHAPSLEKEPRHDCVSCLIHSLPVTTTFAPLHPPPLCVLGPVQSSSTCRNFWSSITITRPLPLAGLFPFLRCRSVQAASRRIGAVEVVVGSVVM